MPKTLGALDSLLARLLEREALVAIAAIVVTVVEGWRSGGSVGAVAAALILGRSFVKMHRA